MKDNQNYPQCIGYLVFPLSQKTQNQSINCCVAQQCCRHCFQFSMVNSVGLQDYFGSTFMGTTALPDPTPTYQSDYLNYFWTFEPIIQHCLGLNQWQIQQQLTNASKNQQFMIKYAQKPLINNQREEINKSNEIIYIQNFSNREKNSQKLQIIINNILQKKEPKGQQQNLETLHLDKHLLEIVKIFKTKAKEFKKSKQQLLKIIVRRIQSHHKKTNVKQNNLKFCLYGGHKSMNISYLSELFKDEQFIDSYKQVANNFSEQFSQENQIKIDSFLAKCLEINDQADVAAVATYLNAKGKMPWPQIWMEKINKVLKEIYWRYIVKDLRF